MLKKLFNRTSKSKQAVFTGFGIFSNIHCYFREKYRTDIDHKDFYTCAEHFFKALLAVLEGVDFKGQAPAGSVTYAKLYADLCASSPFDANVVVVYLGQLSDRASHAVDQTEKMFYQRFLAREALPLLFSPTLSNEQFDAIIAPIPGDMLLNEQAFSCINKTRLFSNLFLQLSESRCETAIDRYCKIVALFPVTDKRAQCYLFSASLLKSMDIMTKNEIQDTAMASTIFQALLLSVRSKDQAKADVALRQSINDIEFIASTLCDESFLHALGRKGIYGAALGSMVLVERLFVFCLWPDADHQNIKIIEQLNHAFSDYADNHDNEPLLHVAASSQEGMRFFGMLDPKIVGSVYTEERLLSMLNKIKQRNYFGSALEEKERDAALAKQDIRVTVLSFILYSLHPTNEVDIVTYCEALSNRKEKKITLAISKRLEAYLHSRLKLYPESDVQGQLTMCVNTLKGITNFGS